VRGRLDDGVGVGRDLDVRDVTDGLEETGVERVEPLGEVRTRDDPAAGQADHPVVTSVQVDDVARARVLVQQVHVLRDDPGEEVALLEPDESFVPGIRQRPVHVLPAHVVTRPVVPAELLVPHELLVGHRAARRGVGPAVVGDAGVGRDPGACERREPEAGEHLDGVVHGGAGNLDGLRLPGGGSDLREHPTRVCRVPAVDAVVCSISHRTASG
jgi:hypothetical protein